MGIFADPANLTWARRETKRQNDLAVRKRLATSIIKKGHFNCLSFPAASWIFEQDLCNSFSEIATFHFTGLEIDKEVFAKTFENAQKLDLPNGVFETTAEARSLLQFLGTSNDPWSAGFKFDFVYADWMGTWNFDTKEAVRRMFVRKVIAHNGFLLITIMLGRGTTVTLQELDRYMIEDHFYEVLDLEEDPDEKTTQRMTDSAVGPLKVMGVTNLISSMARQNGQDIRLVRMAIYDSQSVVNERITTPEISLLYRVIHTQPND